MQENHQSKRIEVADRLDNPTEVRRQFMAMEGMDDPVLRKFMENQLYTALDYRLKHLRSYNDEEHDAIMRGIVDACAEFGYIPMYDATTLPEINPMDIASSGSGKYVYGYPGTFDRTDIIASGEMRCIATLGIEGYIINGGSNSSDGSHTAMMTYCQADGSYHIITWNLRDSTPVLHESLECRDLCVMNDGRTIVTCPDNGFTQIVCLDGKTRKVLCTMEDDIPKIIAVDQDTILAIGDRSHILHLSEDGCTHRSVDVGLSLDSMAYARDGLIHVLSGSHIYTIHIESSKVVMEQDLSSLIHIPWDVLYEGQNGVMADGIVGFRVSPYLTMDVRYGPSMESMGYRIRRRTDEEERGPFGTVKPEELSGNGIWTAIQTFKDLRFDLASVEIEGNGAKIRVGILKYDPDKGAFEFMERSGDPVSIGETRYASVGNPPLGPDKYLALTGRGAVTIRRWGMESRMDSLTFTENGPKHNGNAIIIPGSRTRKVIPIGDGTKYVICDEGPEFGKTEDDAPRDVSVQVRIVDVGPDARIRGNRSGHIIQVKGAINTGKDPILSPDGDWIALELLYDWTEHVSVFDLRNGSSYPNRPVRGKLVGMEDDLIVIHSSKEPSARGTYDVCRHYDRNMNLVREHDMFVDVSHDVGFTEGHYPPVPSREGEVTFVVTDSHEVDDDRPFGHMRTRSGVDHHVEHVELKIGTWHNGHSEGIVTFGTDIETDHTIESDVYECLRMRSFRRDGGSYDYVIQRVLGIGPESTYEFTWIRDGEVQDIRVVTVEGDVPEMLAAIGPDGMSYVDQSSDCIVLCTIEGDFIHHIPSSGYPGALYADPDQAVAYNESGCLYVGTDGSSRTLSNTRTISTAYPFNAPMPLPLSDLRFHESTSKGPVFKDRFGTRVILDLEHGEVCNENAHPRDEGYVRTFEAVYGHRME